MTDKKLRVPELYHLVFIKGDKKIRLTDYPMSHKECMAMKSKFNRQEGITVEAVFGV